MRWCLRSHGSGEVTVAAAVVFGGLRVCVCVCVCAFYVVVFVFFILLFFAGKEAKFPVGTLKV